MLVATKRKSSISSVSLHRIGKRGVLRQIQGMLKQSHAKQIMYTTGIITINAVDAAVRVSISGPAESRSCRPPIALANRTALQNLETHHFH